MQKISIDKFDLIFITAVVVFVLSKIAFLSMPYFWDEAWVYGPAVNIMAENGPSLLPNVIPPEYSRGHPLLFHFIGGIWIKIFGNSLFSTHVYPLVVSIIFFSSFYRISKKWFSPETALFTSLFIITQGMVYAQTTFLLPEIMVSLFSLWAIFFFVENQWRNYILCAIGAIATKESGIVIPVAMFAVPFSLWLIERHKISWKNLLLTISPLLFFVLFLLGNKLFLGWFLYPEHVDMVKPNPLSSETINKSLSICKDIFFFQGRAFPLIITLGTLLYLVYQNKKISLDIKKVIAVVMFTAAMVSFSAMNFYSTRYIIPVIAPLAIIFFAFIFQAYRDKKNVLYILSFLLIAISFSQMLRKSPTRDINLSYMRYCPLQKQVVDYLEKNAHENTNIYSGFLVQSALEEKYSGYRSTSDEFVGINSDSILYDKKVVVLSSVEQAEYIKKHIDDSFKEIMNIQKGRVWFKVYQNF